jgi:hypothetical protein
LGFDDADQPSRRRFRNSRRSGGAHFPPQSVAFDAVARVFLRIPAITGRDGSLHFRRGVSAQPRRLERPLRLEDESGSSLPEALIAVAVVVAITTGVAQLIVRSRQAVWSTGTQSAAVAIAQQKLEQLSALEWRVDARGVKRSDRISDLSIDPPGTAGSGLRASPDDSLDRNAPGFSDFLGPEGDWLGRGADPAAGTAFIRRWSIAPYSRDPGDTLVLTVVVVLPAGGARPAARLQTIRTRTMR